MNILNVTDLHMQYGEHTVFDGVEFGIDDGENVAVVGPNGVGKTTLFELLAGDLHADDGTISVRREMRMAYLRQEANFEQASTPRDVVTEAMRKVREAVETHEALSAEVSDCDDPDRLDELLERQQNLQQHIEELGGWNWEHRIENVVDQLGLEPWIDRALDSLSGGQRRRVALARVLLEHPDLLLLDEPTNHLDPDTVEWLEHWLVEFPGAVFVITHDRYFLENVADRILELDEHDGVFVHPPNYQTFMQRKFDRMAIRQRTLERKQKLIEDELDYLDRGMKSQDRDTKDRAEKLEELADEVESIDYERERADMELHAERDFGVEILAARGIHKSYGGNQVLEDVHLHLAHGDKIGLLGSNGCGKTTLLRIMLGEERPDSGRIEKGDKTDIAHMSQQPMQFAPDETIYDAFSNSDYVWVGDTRHHKRDFLRQFLFDYDHQKEKVSTLSGGQLRRLQLAKVVSQNANLLFLDEPTNDLDLSSMQALEEALRQFEGCSIVVSHDRYFLNRVCNVIVAFEDGELNRYRGNYDDYREQVEARREAKREAYEGTTSQSSRHGGDDESTADHGDGTDDESDPLSYQEQQEFESIESRILEAEARKEELEAKLQDPDLYDDDSHREVRQLNDELRDIEGEIETLYERWEELGERAEG